MAAVFDPLMPTQTRLPTGFLVAGGNGFTSSSGTADKWLEIDDPLGAPDEDASYVFRQNSNGAQSFTWDTFDIPSNATIVEVRVGARARSAGSGDPVLRLGLRIGGSNFNASNDPLTSSYANYVRSWPTNPSTSAAWTVSDLATIDCAILGAIGMASGEELRVTQAWIEVDYTVPDAGDGGQPMTKRWGGTPHMGTMQFRGGHRGGVW